MASRLKSNNNCNMKLPRQRNTFKHVAKLFDKPVTVESVNAFIELLKSVWNEDPEEAHSLEFWYRNKVFESFAKQEVSIIDVGRISDLMYNLGKRNDLVRWFS